MHTPKNNIKGYTEKHLKYVLVIRLMPLHSILQLELSPR